MRVKMVNSKELENLESRLTGVLNKLSQTEGTIDIDAEFQTAVTGDDTESQELYQEIRELARRFGPKLIEQLGFPAVPGAVSVHITPDRTRALLDITPPTGDGRAVTEQDVHRELGKQGVVFGIDAEAIRAAVERGRSKEVRNVTAAAGSDPVNGNDGRIELLRDGTTPKADHPASPVKGGRVLPIADIETVEKGAKIARLLAPTNGIAGKDVYGKTIEAVPGEAIQPQTGEGVTFDSKNAVFIANDSGRVVLDWHG